MRKHWLFEQRNKNRLRFAFYPDEKNSKCSIWDKKMQMFLFWRKKKKSNIPFLQETETHFLSLCVYAYFVRSSCQLRLWIRQKFIWYNMVISIYILLCIAFTWLLSSVWMLFVCLCELNDYSSYSGSRMYSRYKCTTTE